MATSVPPKKPVTRISRKDRCRRWVPSTSIRLKACSSSSSMGLSVAPSCRWLVRVTVGPHGRRGRTTPYPAGEGAMPAPPPRPTTSPGRQPVQEQVDEPVVVHAVRDVDGPDDGQVE